MDNGLIIDISRPAAEPPVRFTEMQVRHCEITRSFSFKLNVGNYESRDFFMSQKVECRIEDAEITSDAVYQFCKQQVLKAVAQYQKESREMFAPDKGRK